MQGPFAARYLDISDADKTNIQVRGLADAVCLFRCGMPIVAMLSWWPKRSFVGGNSLGFCRMLMLMSVLAMAQK